MKLDNKTLGPQFAQPCQPARLINARISPALLMRCVALGVSILLNASLAQAGEDLWAYNVEIFASSGDERDLTGFDILLPIWQDTSSLAFADFRATRSSEDTTEINLGLGYRKLLSRHMIGAHLFYDTRTTLADDRFNQLTVGAELLSQGWDLRFNIYTPASDQEKLDGSEPEEQFFGRRIFVSGDSEEVLDGFDIEFAYLIHGLKWESRIFLAAYAFSGDNAEEEANGGRLSFETRPQENVALSLSYQNDSLFDSQFWGEVRYSFAYSHQPVIRKLTTRMIESVRRDVD